MASVRAFPTMAMAVAMAVIASSSSVAAFCSKPAHHHHLQVQVQEQEQVQVQVQVQVPSSRAFSTPKPNVILQVPSTKLFSSSTSSEISFETLNKYRKAVFDFSAPCQSVDEYSNNNNDNDSTSASASIHPIKKFERIDDAIMGGISTSSLKFVPNAPYSSWSGICRTDGGGFCGMRTLAFREPLQVNADTDIGTDTDAGTDIGIGTAAGADSNAMGLYVKCRLASDNEPNRRVWKMTIRTDSSRGELVYQSQFEIPKSKNFQSPFDKQGQGQDQNQDQDHEEQEWQTIYVPFVSFQQVRGPRIVPNGGEPLDLSKGIYQIGMTMSKFQMGLTTNELDDFRAGYFDLHIQQIGLYYNENGNGNGNGNVNVDGDENENESATDTKVESSEENINTNTNAATDQQVVSIQTLTKEEMLRKRPLLLKVLLSMSKVFFSEQANRRKSAMNILRQKRNMSRIQAIQFGLRSRSQSMGFLKSAGKTVSILGIDTLRTVLKNVFKVALVYPLRLVRKVLKIIGLGGKKEKKIAE